MIKWWSVPKVFVENTYLQTNFGLRFDDKRAYYQAMMTVAFQLKSLQLKGLIPGIKFLVILDSPNPLITLKVSDDKHAFDI